MKTLFLAVLLLNTPVFAAFTLIAHGSSNASNSSQSVVGPLNTTGATLYIQAVTLYSPGTTWSCSVSDSQGNTWRLARSQKIGSEAESALYYAWGVTGAAAVTFNVTGCSGATATYPNTAVQAWSGALTASDPFDVANGAISASGVTFIQAGSLTSAKGNELVVSSVGDGGSGRSITSVDSGMTISDTACGGGECVGLAYLTSSPTINPKWIITAGNSASSIVASFKSSAVVTGSKSQGSIF